MPRFKGFKFSLNLSSNNNSKSDEISVSPVYITGAYKVIGEQFYGAGSYGESPKKITPVMVKLPPAFQPDPTDPDVIKASKSTSNLYSPNLQNVPPNLRKSTPEVSNDPRGGTASNRQSTDFRNTTTESKTKKDQKSEKKKIAEQKKQEKIEAQKKAKEETLRKEREKAELKEQAKQEKIRLQKEKADKAKTKKEVNKPAKARTNPLAQGPNAPLPYQTNTVESSISKSSGPPPYEATNHIAVEAKSVNSSEVVQNDNDGTGNTSFGAPIDSGSTWDLIAQHRAHVSRTPVGGAANKVAIRLQEPLEPNNAVTGRKSLYV